MQMKPCSSNESRIETNKDGSEDDESFFRFKTSLLDDKVVPGFIRTIFIATRHERWLSRASTTLPKEPLPIILRTVYLLCFRLDSGLIKLWNFSRLSFFVMCS